MDGTLFALLVGIDRYLAPEVSRLYGCVNDVERIADILQQRCAGPDRLRLLTLRDAEATRAGIITAFRTHFADAGPDDSVLYFHAGHGSQERAPREFWEIEPDHLDETLVCHDSRTADVRDLADKELAKLIDEVARSGATVTVVLDACHSANGTRVIGPGVRRAPVDERPRPVESFIVDPVEATRLAAAGGDSGWHTTGPGRHVLLAACRADEESREVYEEGRQCGVFSHFLARTLAEAPGELTCREIVKRAGALVRARVRGQNPQLEAVHAADFDRPFLTVGRRPPTFTVSWDGDRNWVVDAGAVHGIAEPDGDESTVLVLYPPGTPPDGLRDRSAAAGQAVVTRVRPADSRVRLTLNDAGPADRAAVWAAVVIATPLRRMPVAFTGAADHLDAARTALAEADDAGGPSLFVREAPAEQAEFGLTATDQGYELRRLPEGQPVAPPATGPGAATTAIRALEHIARWRRIAGLTNVGRLPSEVVRLRVHRWDDEVAARTGEPPELPAEGGLRLEYAYRDGSWHPPQIKISLTNTGDRPLFCMLTDLPESFSIFSGFFPAGGLWLGPGERGWALDNAPLEVTVPDDLADRGVVTLDEILKLIVSTEEADATLLDQSELAQLTRAVTTRGTPGPPVSTLDRLIRRVQLRHIRPAGAETYADWTTAQIKVTVVRPRAETPLPAPGGAADLAPGVSLLGHDGVAGTPVRLTTEDEAARAAAGPGVPPALRDQSGARSFEFQATRSGMAGPGVLELRRSTGSEHRSVTPENPLVLRIAAAPEQVGTLLPVAHDGEFFLPLGCVRPGPDGTEVVLDLLPAPVAGAVRVFFRRLPEPERPAPGLALVETAADGSVAYDGDPEHLRKRLAGATDVLLYLPGLVAAAPPVPPGAGALLLSFDGTGSATVQQAAAALDAALAGAGLTAGQGRRVHLVAHSTGGLVARWFTERCGGAAVVTRMTLLGTPNGGLPWPRAQDWATLVLAADLNGLISTDWPAQVRSGLLDVTRSAGVDSAGQWRAGSDLLTALAASADPGVPYVVVAGHAPVPAAAVEGQASGDTVAGRLLDRLRLPDLGRSAALAFLRAPNDLLVSGESAGRLPAGWQPAPVLVRADCDHFTYLRTPEVLDALGRAG